MMRALISKMEIPLWLAGVSLILLAINSDRILYWIPYYIEYQHSFDIATGVTGITCLALAYGSVAVDILRGER